MITVAMSLPTETMKRLKDPDLEPALKAVGYYITAKWMPELFRSSGKGSWKPVLRGGQPLLDKGVLVRGFFHAVTADKKAVIITNTGKPPQVVGALNYGATIRPKKAKFLRFKIGDRWAMRKQVTIPARPFFRWWPEMKLDAISIAKTKIAQTLGAKP
jgi:phage gpG-like protein